MGNVEHRGGDKYLLRVNVGYKQNGSPVRKHRTVRAKTEKKAYAMLALFEHELETQGYLLNDEFRFQAFVENEWLPKYAEKELAYNTRALYLLYLERYFYPNIGKKKLKDITPLMIVNIMDNLQRANNPAQKNKQGEPLSKSTKRNILLSARSVFEVAVTWQLIPQNPAKGVKTGKDERSKKKTYKPYTTKELAYIFECLEKEPLEMQVMLSLALLSGAREGEIAALEEKHIKAYAVDGQAVYAVVIEQTIITKDKIGAVLQPHTKTDVSEEVTITKELYDMIQQHIAGRKALRKVLQLNGHYYLFCHPDGKPYRPRSLNQRFERFLKRYGIRKVRFHDLRHSHATYMIMEGVKMKIVQERLRHKKLSTTMDTYAHVLQEHDQQAVEILSKMTGKNAIRTQNVHK